VQVRQGSVVCLAAEGVQKEQVVALHAEGTLASQL